MMKKFAQRAIDTVASPAKALLATLLFVAPVVGLVDIASATTYSDGTTVTYSKSTVISPPPASDFSAPGAGDGYALAFYNGNVYNIFHGPYQVDCHVKATAASCPGYPKSMSDGPNQISADYYAEMKIDSSTGHMQFWGFDNGDFGVVTIDLTTTSPNPFLSFAKVGNIGSSGTTNPVFVGNKWYIQGAAQMFCFDTSLQQACANQPYGIANLTSAPNWPPEMENIAGKLYFETVPGQIGSDYTLDCFDPATNSACGGAFPIILDPNSNPSGLPPRPTLNAAGVVNGLCIQGGSADACFDLSGNSVAVPAGYSAALIDSNNTSGYGDFVIMGTRTYLPAADGLSVACYDFATNATCPHFPLAFDNRITDGLYTVQSDPTNPSCLWVNADSGDYLINSFDAYTGGACGSGGSRVLLSNFVVPVGSCTPTTFGSLSITSPAPSAYSNGTVTIEDASGTSVGVKNIDGSGVVSFASTSIPTGGQLLIDLPGATSSTIDATLTWTGEYHTACVADGQTVSGPSQVTVSYSAGSGSGTVPGTQTVTKGTSITLPSADGLTPPKGAAFAGWSDGTSTYAAGATYTVSSSVTMTALWTTPVIAYTGSDLIMQLGIALMALALGAYFITKFRKRSI